MKNLCITSIQFCVFKREKKDRATLSGAIFFRKKILVIGFRLDNAQLCDLNVLYHAYNVSSM